MPYRRTTLFVAACLVTAGCAVEEASSPGPEVIQDVIYGHKLGMALTLNVYPAHEPNGAGILFMNSGGWLSPFCRFLTDGAEPIRLLTDAELGPCRMVNPEYMTSRGFTVFDVRHGSAPQFTVVDATADVRLALQFVQGHASEYGVDPSRLGVWGGSAGGQLSLMLGQSGLQEASGTGGGNGSVAAIVAYMPAVNLEPLAELDVGIREATGLGALSAEELRAVSPINFTTSDDPPTLIIHGDEDQVVPHSDGEAMYQALQAVGVESEFITLEGAPHGFTGAYADSALAASLAWFEAHLSR